MELINDTMDWLNTNKDKMDVVEFQSSAYENSIRFIVTRRGASWEKVFDIRFLKDSVFIDPKSASYNIYYKDEPMVLDLLNLLVEINLESVPNNIISGLRKIRQNIVLRLL